MDLGRFEDRALVRCDRWRLDRAGCARAVYGDGWNPTFMERGVVSGSNSYCMPDYMVAAPRCALALPHLLSHAGDAGFGRYAGKMFI